MALDLRVLADLLLVGNPKHYLLRDEFSSDLAAGAVNGTPAVPGPGTRVVLDTNGIMSLAGGVLVVNGTPATNNLFHIGSVARVAGRVFKITFPTVVTVGAGAVTRFGFSIGGGSPQTLYPGADYSSTTAIRLKDGAAPIYTLTLGAAPHSFAFVTRATGGWSYALISGIWRMLYIHPTDSTATMFPMYVMGNAVAHNLTIDGFRVPQSLYISSLWYDSFTRDNGALGSSESVGPDSQATPITAWVNQEGTTEVVGNAAQATALAGGIANATLLTTYADAHIRAALTRAAGNVGINARYQDSSNYLRAYHDGTNAVCQQVVAGVATTLRTGAAAFSAGAYIYLLLRGTTGWLFYNGVAVGASFTVPASTYAAHGVHTTDLGNTVPVFEAWPDGGGGEHWRLGTM